VGVIAFDVNGTLLDPADQAEQLQSATRLAMAHTLAGDFRPAAPLAAQRRRRARWRQAGR
jgi:hypothetical protein